MLDESLLAWVGAISLMVSGILYLSVHFGCHKDISREDAEEEYDDSYKERLVWLAHQYLDQYYKIITQNLPRDKMIKLKKIVYDDQLQ